MRMHFPAGVRPACISKFQSYIASCSHKHAGPQCMPRPYHRVCLAAASLAVGEHSGIVALEQACHKWLHTFVIQPTGWLATSASKGIVEVEGVCSNGNLQHCDHRDVVYQRWVHALCRMRAVWPCQTTHVLMHELVRLRLTCGTPGVTARLSWQPASCSLPMSGRI